MARFLAYDHVVESALDLPGAMPLPDGPAPADLRIVLNAPAPTLPTAPLYQHDADALMFTPPGVGAYRITPSAIAVTPLQGAVDADIAALLIATALPAWLWLGRRLVLHAAAVVLPGAARALVIGGATGSGKSTMLAALLARGAAMVGDDTLAIDGDRPVPLGSGLAGGYFWRVTIGGARAIQPAAHGVRRAPLGAVLLLDRGGGAPQFERLTPVAAMPELLASRHRPAVPRLLGRDAIVLAQCASLATTLPIYRWHRTDAAPTLSDLEYAHLERISQQG
ncbi:hypothetical protein [Sphingomonas sp. PB4P5]|uniref:hypothetical protein n=1 Tax=Parasphingomonas puruogangriensis TaxID=3096155 RepID=UPI002FCC2B2C